MTHATLILSTLTSEVIAALPALRGQPWQPLSGGRTNHLWRVGASVVKAYDPAAATPLFPNDPLAEARALTLLGPLDLAPRLQAAGPGWVAYAHIEGTVWQAHPAPVARTLHRLHQLSAPGFRTLPSGSAAILAQGQFIAAACRGTLPPAPRDPGIAALDYPRLIHGDAVPGNMIAGLHHLMLIDWQCPAMGDPAEDLATFLSPAMQWLYRGAVLTPDQAKDFLGAYADPASKDRYKAMAPLFRWRMAAHCLWKAERGAADYATALHLELSA